MRPHQDVVQPAVAVAGLDHVLVGRRSSTMHSRPGSRLGIGTGRADLVFGKAVAARNGAGAARRRKSAGPACRPLQVVLQQVIGHAAGRAHAHARQAAQRLDQGDQRFGFGELGIHRATAARPAARQGHAKALSEQQLHARGSGMPAVTDAIFSCEVASRLRSASLNAAAPGLRACPCPRPAGGVDGHP